LRFSNSKKSSKVQKSEIHPPIPLSITPSHRAAHLPPLSFLSPRNGNRLPARFPPADLFSPLAQLPSFSFRFLYSARIATPPAHLSLAQLIPRPASPSLTLSLTDRRARPSDPSPTSRRPSLSSVTAAPHRRLPGLPYSSPSPTELAINVHSPHAAAPSSPLPQPPPTEL
jgi:hypothetical protein